MLGQSVSLAEKDSFRSTFEDWENRCDEFQKTSSALCERSFEMRRDSALTRLAVRNQTRWDAYHNEDKLSDRVWEVRSWQEELERVLAASQVEESTLSGVKRELEVALQQLTVPLAVASECAALRDARRDFELTRDQPAVSLQEELRVLEQHKSGLTALGAEAWCLLERLASLHAELHLAITEQAAALRADQTALALTPLSPGLALRPEPARLPHQSSVPAAWSSHCEALAEKQRALCLESRALREAMLAAVAAARNSELAQREQVDREIRMRAFTLQRALDDLEWQGTQLRGELGRAEGEVSRLQDSYRSLGPPRRLCETRHERRCTERPPGAERCQDPAQDGLEGESAALQAAEQRLERALATARTTYGRLRSQLARVERETDTKRAALALERRCQAVREQTIGRDEVGGDMIRVAHLAASSSDQL